jgi:hypothetical protein
VKAGVGVGVGVAVQAGLLVAMLFNGVDKAVLGVWFEQETPNNKAVTLIPAKMKITRIRFIPKPFLLEPQGCSNREV